MGAGNQNSGRRTWPVLHDSPGKSAKEPAQSNAVQRAPGMLTKRGRAEWRRLARVLARDGRLTPTSRPVLMTLCLAHENLWAAADMLRADPESEPARKLLVAAEATLLRCCELLQLCPGKSTAQKPRAGTDQAADALAKLTRGLS